MSVGLILYGQHYHIGAIHTMTNQTCDICGERAARWIDTRGIQICGLCGVLVLRDERRDGTDYLAYPLRSVDGERWFRRYRSN